MPPAFAPHGYGRVDFSVRSFTKKSAKSLLHKEFDGESRVKFTPRSDLIPPPLTLLFYAGFKACWHCRLNKGTPPGRDQKATGGDPGQEQEERPGRRQKGQGDRKNGSF
jgi:hypothetical protein